MSLRCAPGRAARAVGNDTTVANRAGPPPRQASPRIADDRGRGAVPALRARIPHATAWRTIGWPILVRRDSDPPPKSFLRTAARCPSRHYGFATRRPGVSRPPWYGTSPVAAPAAFTVKPTSAPISPEKEARGRRGVHPEPLLPRGLREQGVALPRHLDGEVRRQLVAAHVPLQRRRVHRRRRARVPHRERRVEQVEPDVVDADGAVGEHHHVGAGGGVHPQERAEARGPTVVPGQAPPAPLQHVPSQPRAQPRSSPAERRLASAQATAGPQDLAREKRGSGAAASR